MLDLTIHIQRDTNRSGREAVRAFDRARKAALLEATDRWYREFFPRHFTRGAYARYSDSMPRRKPSPRLPFVLTGHLREHLKSSGNVEISGTSRAARVRLKLGRPPRYREGVMRSRIFYLMKERSWSYKQARDHIWNTAGYGAKSVAMFQKGMTAIDDAEVRKLSRGLTVSMTRQMNKPASVRRVSY